MTEEQEAEIVRRLTAAMREADRTFERVGGSTRHHIRDCLVPILGKHGLAVQIINQESPVSNEQGEIIEGMYMAASHKPSINLRFVLRDGKRILQQMYYPNDWMKHAEEWRDIKLCDAETGHEISG